MTALRYVRPFDEIGNTDVASVGGKNASIGEMHRQLADHGVNVPHGFAVTAEGYRHVLDEAGAWPELAAAFKGLQNDDVADLDLICVDRHVSSLTDLAVPVTVSHVL